MHSDDRPSIAALTGCPTSPPVDAVETRVVLAAPASIPQRRTHRALTTWALAVRSTGFVGQQPPFEGGIAQTRW